MTHKATRNHTARGILLVVAVFGLVFGVLLMHDPPPCFDPHPMAMPAMTGVVGRAHSDAAASGPAGVFDACRTHSHDCMGVTESGPHVVPGTAPVWPPLPAAGTVAATAAWVAAAGGRGPPWTVLSLSQLSVLRV
jgi:hypothetical protein